MSLPLFLNSLDIWEKRPPSDVEEGEGAMQRHAGQGNAKLPHQTMRYKADLSLDLDDGVKVNYGKFGDLLAEVKAVCGKEED